MKKFMFQNKGILLLASVLFLMVGEAILKLIQAERYGLAVVFMIAITLFASAFVSAYKEPEHPSKGAAYLTKFWSMPLTTTRIKLWMRAGIVVLIGMGLYSGIRYGSWTDSDGTVNLAIMAVDGMKVLLWLPFLYWSFRNQYSPVLSNQTGGNKSLELLMRHSDNPRKLSRRETLIIALVMLVAIATFTTIGAWID